MDEIDPALEGPASGEVIKPNHCGSCLWPDSTTP